MHFQVAQQALQPDQRWYDIDDTWSGTRADYVPAIGAASAGVTHAALIEGEWLDADDFGADWEQRLCAILSGVPHDMLVTIVDCHV